MTLRETYEYGQEQLNKVGISDAALDAWYLLEYITGIDRTAYFLRMEESLDAEQEQQYCACIATRAKRVPLQHITGVQEFMGIEFCVNEHVLIPRQDTEILVEQVLKILEPGMNILDMCTGSGCILLSLLKLGKNVSGVGADISKEALNIARKNCNKIGVQATILQSDLFAEISGQYDVIVSNPPYIATPVIGKLQDEVRLYDPILALDGKEDGLYFYRKIIQESPAYLKAKGKLYFEIGYDQGHIVKQLMEDAGFVEVTVKKDLAGLDRVVFGVYNV